MGFLSSVNKHMNFKSLRLEEGFAALHTLVVTFIGMPPVMLLPLAGRGESSAAIGKRAGVGLVSCVGPYMHGEVPALPATITTVRTYVRFECRVDALMYR